MRTGPWGDPEIADLCDTGYVARMSGRPYAVQELWSDAATACVRAAP